MQPEREVKQALPNRCSQWCGKWDGRVRNWGRRAAAEIGRIRLGRSEKFTRLTSRDATTHYFNLEGAFSFIEEKKNAEQSTVTVALAGNVGWTQGSVSPLETKRKNFREKVLGNMSGSENSACTRNKMSKKYNVLREQYVSF